jgi:hypothetical protein
MVKDYAKQDTSRGWGKQAQLSTSWKALAAVLLCLLFNHAHEGELSEVQSMTQYF